MLAQRKIQRNEREENQTLTRGCNEVRRLGLLLLGVSVRWTSPVNPSVDESPENRLIQYTPCGWRNLATNVCNSKQRVQVQRISKKYSKNTQALYQSCFLIDWSPDEAAASKTLTAAAVPVGEAHAKLARKELNRAQHQNSSSVAEEKRKKLSSSSSPRPLYTCEEDSEETSRCVATARTLIGLRTDQALC